MYLQSASFAPRCSLHVREHVLRVRAEDDKDEDGDERVRAAVGAVRVPDETEDDLAAVEDADHFVSGGFVVVDFEKFWG